MKSTALAINCPEEKALPTATNAEYRSPRRGKQQFRAYDSVYRARRPLMLNKLLSLVITDEAVKTVN